MIGIVDLGVMAIGSWQNLLSSNGFQTQICKVPEQLGECDVVIFPGVGNFSKASDYLDEGGWRRPLIQVIEKGVPFLGVCLGMQLMGKGSDEGPGSGLGLFNFSVERFPQMKGARVPHMGWNTVRWNEGFGPKDDRSEFYFTHSFALLDVGEWTVGTTSNGIDFTSAIASNNVLGVQFHPEKSHSFGRSLIFSFLEKSQRASA